MIAGGVFLGLALVWLLHLQRGDGAGAKFERAMLQLARKRRVLPWVMGVVAALASATLSTVRPTTAAVTDEFSYLLAADTFAHGRLTNPPHPLWRHFEAFQVLQQPSYMSKFPPGQGLMLALGSKLAGTPQAGIWLSSGLAAAAVCWMLQGWLGAYWAIFGTLIFMLQAGVGSYWSQSYWGGLLAATGGALLFGALFRLRKCWRLREVFWFAAGTVLLANTRPFEGLLAVLPAAALVTVWLFGRRAPAASGRRAVLLGFAAVLLPAAAWMGYYNWRITGDPFRLPYSRYHAQYDCVPDFLIVQKAVPAPPLAEPKTAERFRALQQWELSQYVAFHTARGFSLALEKVAALWFFFIGVVWTLPLLLLAAFDPRRWPGRIQTGIVLGISLTLFCGDQPAAAACGLALLILEGVLLFLLLPEQNSRIAMTAAAFVLLGILSESWEANSHYFAPIAGLAAGLVVAAFRRARALTRRNAAVKSLLDGFPVFLLLTSVGVRLLVAPATGQDPLLRSSRAATAWATERRGIQTALHALGGAHVVLVRYPANASPHEEWVYNPANIDRAEVVWARELSASRDQELLDYYPDRTVWLLDLGSFNSAAVTPLDNLRQLAAAGRPANARSTATGTATAPRRHSRARQPENGVSAADVTASGKGAACR